MRVNELFVAVRSVKYYVNINLVFHISEDGSEIGLKHCASSKTLDSTGLPVIPEFEDLVEHGRLRLIRTTIKEVTTNVMTLLYVVTHIVTLCRAALDLNL